MVLFRKKKNRGYALIFHKVHLFWEDHKILQNLHRRFVLTPVSEKIGTKHSSVSLLTFVPVFLKQTLKFFSRQVLKTENKTKIKVFFLPIFRLFNKYYGILVKKNCDCRFVKKIYDFSTNTTSSEVNQSQGGPIQQYSQSRSQQTISTFFRYSLVDLLRNILGGFQLLDLIITELKSHMTC